MGIKNYVREERDYYKTRQKTYVRHRLYINGFSRVTAFLRKVGFSNLNKSLRITNMENGPDGI